MVEQVYIRLDYILKLLKAQGSPNNCHEGKKLVVGKNNQVLLTIGPILGISAENTGWLNGTSIQNKMVCTYEITLSLHWICSSGTAISSISIERLDGKGKSPLCLYFLQL